MGVHKHCITKIHQWSRLTRFKHLKKFKLGQTPRFLKKILLVAPLADSGPHSLYHVIFEAWDENPSRVLVYLFYKWPTDGFFNFFHHDAVTLEIHYCGPSIFMVFFW